VAGQWVALIAIPLTWPWVLASFFLFRLFDIAKPPPVNQSQRLPGGWGIVTDDIIAGVYANVVLQAVVHFGPSLGIL
jgi:phosphatidylglycerophosphatase A